VTLFGVINLLNLPLMFASAALFPTTLMPEWLQTITENNPLTLVADGLRQLTIDNPNPIHNLGWDALGRGLFSGALIVICIVASRRPLSNK
jgi:ABC-2 type transport system permease protein